jgi:hypothetical protein
VKQSDLGEYKENVRKKVKDKNIQDKTSTSPQTTPKEWQKSISKLQGSNQSTNSQW